MIQMYDGVVNSIETVTTGAINATDTIINVLNETQIPDAPNILVLGSGASAETVKLVSKIGTALTVERGLQGTAKSWASGTLVARNFTEYDYRAFKENIEEVTTQLAQIQPHLSKQVTDVDGAHGFKIGNGTFTPRVAGGAGGEALYSFQHGTYQLMGNRVFYDLEVVISSKNNIVGDVLISGLPFVLLSTPTQTREVSTYSGIILPSGKYQIGALGLAGTPLLILLASGNQDKKILNVDEITNSFEIRISGSYLI